MCAFHVSVLRVRAFHAMYDNPSHVYNFTRSALHACASAFHVSALHAMWGFVRRGDNEVFPLFFLMGKETM